MDTKSMRDRLANLSTLATEWRHDESRDTVIDVANHLFRSFDTAISLSCALLLKYGEIEQLIRKTVSPLSYLDSRAFEDDYQAVSFLKKYPGFSTGTLARDNAMISFRKAEESCRLTNLRLKRFTKGVENPSVEVCSVLHRAASFIAKVLGPLNYQDWYLRCQFGPGVSDTCKGDGSAYNKLSSRLSVTRDFAEAGLHLVNGSPAWRRSVARTGMGEFCFLEPPLLNVGDLEYAVGNTVTFVPKTAWTDRPIAVEPHLNIFGQLGLGKLIRDKLQGSGLNLFSQQLHHGNLCKSASIRGDLATVDLSSASDTISTELVRLLLPSDWFSALDACRSRFGKLDGELIPYEKFSSMGNGYTFELETLIFWAIARACCRERRIHAYDSRGLIVSCYGDDIIIPIAACDLLAEALAYCGFTYNTEKSFTSGPFRESCGYDFYLGTNVRPIFQKEVLHAADSVYELANRLRAKAYSCNRGFGCDIRYLGAWRNAVNALPNSLRKLVVPHRVDLRRAHLGGFTQILGESRGLIGDFDEATPELRYSSRQGIYGEIEGYIACTLNMVPRVDQYPNAFGAIAAMLYQMDVNGQPAWTVRARSTYRFEAVLVAGLFSAWPNLGGWF